MTTNPPREGQEIVSTAMIPAPVDAPPPPPPPPPADNRLAAEADRDRLRTVLDEVLRQFTHHGHPGRPCVQTWIPEEDVARWRAQLVDPQPGRGTPTVDAHDNREVDGG